MSNCIKATMLAAACLTATLSVQPARAAITDNLVVHLTFDGNLQDSSGRGNHGAPIGTPGFVPGKVGEAVAIVAKKDLSVLNYVTLGAPPDLNFGVDADFTISFWSRFSQWTIDPLLISNKDWTSGQYQGYAIATGTDGRLQWNYSGPPGARKDYDGPAGTISDGNWHHVLIVFLRAGFVATYLDGVEVDARDVSFSLNNVDTPAGLATNLGQDGTATYTDGGSAGVDDLAMDDLGIWRRALTPAEAKGIYTAGTIGQDLTTVVSTPERPSIRSVTGDQGVVAGSRVVLKVLPGGSSPFTYQWKLNGQPVAGGTGAILFLENVQSSESGSYTVDIVNVAGSITSDPITLSVDATEPPEITEQPLPVEAPVGANVSFTVKAIGVAPLTYQWSRNGVTLPQGTNATLALSRIGSADGGNYACTIRAGNGKSTQSDSVTLTLVNDIKNGMLLHLTFDQDFTDSSGRSNNASPVGDPTLVEGLIGGKALRFTQKADGSSFNYLTLGNPADLDFADNIDFSISLWVKFSQWFRDPVFIANKDWSLQGTKVGWALATGADGRFQWNFKEQVGERADYDSGPNLISDGQWHHIAVTFQRGGNATTFVDGVLMNSQKLPGSGTVVDPGYPVNIGQDGTGTYTDFGQTSIEDGTIDDLAIWRRAITAEEIEIIYRKGILLGANVVERAATDDLVAYLPFDGDYEDQSGHGNDGAPVGTPRFAPGKLGSNCLSFTSQADGRSFNYVTLGSPEDLDFGKDSDFSVSFWTRFNTWTGDPVFVGNKDWTSGGNQGWVMATAGNGRLQWNLGDGDAGGRTRKDYDGPAGTISDGQWHHVVVTFDRKGEAITYLDGADVNHTEIAADLDSIDTPAGLATNIGQDGKGTYTDNNTVSITDGQIDDVAFWRRVLAPDEVTSIYTRGAAGTPLLPPVNSPPTGQPLTLQILHASDFEAGIPALADAPRFSSVLSALQAQYPTNTVILAAGDDWIPGPFFLASADPAALYVGKGRADVMILNALGVQASVVGNHEFDDTPATFRDLLRASGSYPGTLFPFLSANLDFSTDSNTSGLITQDGQDYRLMTNKVARSAVIHVAGQIVGVVGATTVDFRAITSAGNLGVDTNVVAAVQAATDALTAQGINKIVLVTQLQQIANEFALAQYLRGVDVIIAGGSDTILAKDTDRLRPGDEKQGDYPTTFTSASGEPVLVVSTDGNYRYVGRLVVSFDARGIIGSVDPSSGAYAADEQGVIATGNVPPNPSVTSIVTNLQQIIVSKDGNLFGKTLVYLNGLRGSVRTEEANLGDLSADANLWYGKQADPTTSLSIKNGGGIRDSIGAISTDGVRVPPLANPLVGKAEGQVSQLDIENALRFNNGLSLLTVTAQQLRDAVEWGVAAVAPGATPGQFPQVAGMWFAYNPTNAPMSYTRDANNVPTGISAPGNRVQSLVATRGDGSLDLVVENGQLLGDPNRTFRMITLDFLAGGGDNYYALTLGTQRMDLGTSTNRAFTTPGGEQWAFASYLTTVKVYAEADNPAGEDERIQSMASRTDTVTWPLLTHLAQGGAQTTVYFTSLPGKHYEVWATDNIAGPWVKLTATPLAGTGMLLSFADSAGLAPQRFYQIRRTE